MFEIGEGCEIHPSARIEVAHGYLGDRAVIREGAVIEGHHVEIGAEAFLNRGAWIGGGSCRDRSASLVCGDFLHMGWNSHINIARPVRIGHEFGFGVESKLFSHGAYLSVWEGFPVDWQGVTVGDRVWLPNAWVNPGVTLGSDIVVAAHSLVNRDLPSGCLAGGAPARVLRTDAFPQVPDPADKRRIFAGIFDHVQGDVDQTHAWEAEGEGAFRIDRATLFDLDRRHIEGPATDFTERLRAQLRRNGVRFRYKVERGGYVPWRGVLTGPRRL
jgi:acetyltransferase-like isoleucine patch superfamily enzyme